MAPLQPMPTSSLVSLEGEGAAGAGGPCLREQLGPPPPIQGWARPDRTQTRARGDWPRGKNFKDIFPGYQSRMFLADFWGPYHSRQGWVEARVCLPHRQRGWKPDSLPKALTSSGATEERKKVEFGVRQNASWFFFPFFTKDLNTFTWVRNMWPSDSPPWLHFWIPWTTLKKKIQTPRLHAQSMKAESLGGAQHWYFVQLRLRSTDVVPPSTKVNY